MSTPPEQRDRNMVGTGGKLIAVGVVLMIIGALLTGVIPTGIAWVIFAIGCLPAAAGIGLVLSGLVSRRSRAGKPFA